MTRSTAWIKALINMNKLNKWLFLCLGICLLCSCGSKVMVKTGSHFETGFFDTVPYALRQQANAQHLLLYLSPALDSFSFRGSALEKAIMKAGYQVLIIDKPTGSDYYTLKNMDYKSTRQTAVQRTFYHLRDEGVLDYKKLVVLGIGEGAYLAPSLATMFEADSAVMINGGPFSEMIEIERAAQDGVDDTEAEFFDRVLRISKQEDLLRAVENVRQGRADAFALGPHMNKYWLTYNAAITAHDYQHMPGHAVWIFFDKYPLHKAQNEQYIRSLSGMRKEGSSEQIILPGTGNISESELQQRLAEKLLEILDN